MDPFNNNNTPASSTNVRLFLAKAFLSFHKITRKLKTANKQDRTKHNLAIRILLLLSIQSNVLKARLIRELNSNHASISQALENLRLDGYITEDLVYEYRTRNKLRFQSSVYRLSLKGTLFIQDFMDAVGAGTRDESGS